MRHPQGGGLTAERQQFREELRLKAAERFARGEASSVIARDLQVSVRSVQRWRRMWDEGGPRALRSQGPASLPRLGQQQFAQLEAELAKGPGRARLGRPALDPEPCEDGDRPALPPDLHDPGRPQTPGAQRLVLPGPGLTGDRAGRRGGDRVGQGGVALRGRLAAVSGAWLVFEDEAGFSMTPPQTRIWSPRGRTQNAADLPAAPGRRPPRRP